MDRKELCNIPTIPLTQEATSQQMAVEPFYRLQTCVSWDREVCVCVEVCLRL